MMEDRISRLFASTGKTTLLDLAAAVVDSSCSPADRDAVAAVLRFTAIPWNPDTLADPGCLSADGRTMVEKAWMDAWVSHFGPLRTYQGSSASVERFNTGAAADGTYIPGGVTHPLLMAPASSVHPIPLASFPAPAASPASTSARIGAGGSGLRAAMSLFNMGSDLLAPPLLPMYWGSLLRTSAEATTLLASHPIGTYILRCSASDTESLTVTFVAKPGDVRHMRLQRGEGGYAAPNASTPFLTPLDAISARPDLFITPLESPLAALSLQWSNGYSDLPIPPLPSPLSSMSPLGLAVTGLSGVSSTTFTPATTVDTSGRTPGGTVGSVSGGRNEEEKEVGVVEEEEWDAMLSYQWDDQTLVRRIRDALHHMGYRVWMDETHMSAAYAVSMVRAIRKSRAILICATNKYLNSLNCEVEANLAFENRGCKRIIILNLEAGFYPAKATKDHTLVALAAGRLYCDFSNATRDDAAFNSAVTAVVKQLKEGKIFPVGVTGGSMSTPR